MQLGHFYPRATREGANWRGSGPWRWTRPRRRGTWDAERSPRSGCALDELNASRAGRTLIGVEGWPEESNLMPARLEGGQFDGVEFTARPGQEVIEIGPDHLVLFGGPPEELERMKRTKWRYRYARMEPGDGGERAVFQFDGAVQVDSAEDDHVEPE